MSEGLRPLNEQIFVPIADTTIENLARALGVSEEREKELDYIADKANDDTDNYADCISKISNECANAAELAYSVFYVGAYAENQRQRVARLETLSSLLIKGF